MTYDFEGLDLSYSSDYLQYLDSLQKKELSFYERMCLFFRKFPIILKPSKTRKEKLEKVIQYCELEIKPEDIDNSAFYITGASFIIFTILSFFNFTNLWINIALSSIIFYSLYTYPFFLNEVTRLKANSEMVKAIVYMSISLTITPVFVSAISFASRYLDGPIGNDFRKIMWIIKTQQAQNLETALSYFTDKWNSWNKNFSEALELLKQVEIYVTQEEKENTIREALTLIEETSYDVMKDYSKSLKQPLSIIHSFGIMMPVLGLIMFPLISIFLSSEINIKYLVMGYIVILPSLLFWYIYKVISKRPGAFAHSLSIKVTNQYKKIKILGKEVSLLKLSLMIGIVALLPAMFHFFSLGIKHHQIFANILYPKQKRCGKIMSCRFITKDK
ncbi:MAG: hypothetical protein GXN99_00155 [Candidatus Nanohaloarchaeota archaeon]|nr:hypothetical protein [Candidatus Nanohaloarchaeota archaeon]